MVNGICYLRDSEAIWAVDAQDGTNRWRRSIPGTSLGSSVSFGDFTDPFIGSGLVLTAIAGSVSETNVYAIDASNGEVHWRKAIDLQCNSIQYSSGWIEMGSTITEHLYIDSHIVILSVQSGETWYQQSGICPASGPPVEAEIGTVALPDGGYFTASNTSLNLNNPIYLLNPATRQLIEYPSSSTIYAATQTTLFTGQTIATGSTEYPLQDSLQAVDIGSRKVLWSQLQSGNTIEGVELYGDLIAAITDTGATVMAMDSGQILWSRHEWDFAHDKEVYFHAINENTLLLGIGPEDDESPGGSVLAIDFLTGSTKWSADIVAEPLNIVTASNSLFVAAEGQAIYALDFETGQTKWIVPIDDAAPPTFTVG
jgi:outer membrane protein assembly factor BamB